MSFDCLHYNDPAESALTATQAGHHTIYQFRRLFCFFFCLFSLHFQYFSDSRFGVFSLINFPCHAKFYT